MVRETSVKIFHKINDEGLTKTIQTKLLKVIKEHFPITIREASEIYLPEIKDTTLSPRFSELSDMGAIIGITEKVCSRSGNMVTAWEPTGKMPIKQKMSALEKLNKRIKSTENKLMELRKKKNTLLQKQFKKQKQKQLTLEGIT